MNQRPIVLGAIGAVREFTAGNPQPLLRRSLLLLVLQIWRFDIVLYSFTLHLAKIPTAKIVYCTNPPLLYVTPVPSLSISVLVVEITSQGYRV